MSHVASFCFTAGLDFFEKASAGEKRRRVAGIASTEEEDQEGETILQKGIDWSYFLSKGYFNDNHQKGIGGIVGYPEDVRLYRKGDTLPNDAIAKAHCTWVEGYLLNDDHADRIWKKGMALRGTPRSLGLSIEGKARARSVDGAVVIKSMVSHCAITHMPVNASAAASLFAKSLAQLGRADPMELRKAMRDFERGMMPAKISIARAIDVVTARYPGITQERARQVIELIGRWRKSR